ncbi:MAG: hypothetical protein KBS58_04985 [Bacteroidales bacterium]|nr:hypothetical protein [Candidatus Cacconaster equi]
MKFKSVLFFVLLVAIVASFSFISCHKNDPENDGYSVWTEGTEADLDVFAKARAAYLDDPANATAPEYEMMKSLSEPYAVRTKAEGKGIVYQFSSAMLIVTIYKGDGDEVGKVIEIQGASDGGPGLPPPPTPVKRDTIID